MRFSFKRITSSGGFIPEIDGLRFIAISSVILYHFWCFLPVKDQHVYTDGYQYSFLKQLLSHGNFGVPLFFIISGFILGMPFAKYHLNKGKEVNIKNYFLRRLTRLEPPYILAMTILLFGAVYVAKTLTLKAGLLSYLASVFYVHNLVYLHYPYINDVAWSLEIEVQFYILAPLIAYVFTIRPAATRRIVLIAVTLLFIIFNDCFSLPFISLINFLQYFLVGFLLVDLYISKATVIPKTYFDKLIALALLFVIWLYEKKDFSSSGQMIAWHVFQLACVFFLYYYILFHQVFKTMSSRLITNIGGMCYTIYLIHYPIISLLGNKLVNITFSHYSYINTIIYCAIFIAAIAIASAIFFLFVERPCMDKDWYKKIFNRGKPVAAAK